MPVVQHVLRLHTFEQTADLHQVLIPAAAHSAHRTCRTRAARDQSTHTAHPVSTTGRTTRILLSTSAFCCFTVGDAKRFGHIASEACCVGKLELRAVSLEAGWPSSDATYPPSRLAALPDRVAHHAIKVERPDGLPCSHARAASPQCPCADRERACEAAPARGYCAASQWQAATQAGAHVSSKPLVTKSQPERIPPTSALPSMCSFQVCL